MFRMKNYMVAQTLEDAYECNQGKNNQVIGGYGWLKLQNKTINTGIDLSLLGLDKIQEKDEYFSVGAMVTLRQLETHSQLATLTHGMIRESLHSIVGIQFRNCATVGGSVFSRFGFSDVLTLLLALEAEIVLYRGGAIPIADFAKMPQDNDILLEVRIPKSPMRGCYQSFRIQATDLPIINVAVVQKTEKILVAVGARPARAEVFEFHCVEDAIGAAKQFQYGSNMRGSEAYRAHLAEVLVGRCLSAIEEI